MTIETKHGGRIGKVVLVLLAVAFVLGIGYVGGYYQGTGVFPRFMGRVGTQYPPIVDYDKQTSADVIEFLEQDTTDQEYDGIGMNCYDFCLLMARNASWAGLEAKMIAVDFGVDIYHAVLMFPTADMGYIFVEPQTDKVLDLAVGQYYDGAKIEGLYVLGFTLIPLDEYMASH